MSNITTRNGFAPTTMAEAMEFSNMLASSTMVPRQYQGKPQDIMVCVQWGYEIGLAPMQALQNIAVINGKPSVYGDAAMALVQNSPACEDVQEYFEDEGTPNPVAVCVAKRKGRTPVTSKFSVDDAKRAGLWGKQGPWTQYPKRMMAMRARGFALRDAFPDVLKGLITIEEAQDYPTQAPAKDITPAHMTNPLDAIAAPSPEIPVVQEVEPPVEEVAQTEVDYTQAVDVEGKWVLVIPGKDAALYDSYEQWSAEYSALCDKVASAGRASVETRVQKLNLLREVNEAAFDKMSTEQKVEQIAMQSNRRAHLTEVKNEAA